MSNLFNFTPSDINFSLDCEKTAKFAVLVKNDSAPAIDAIQDWASFPYAQLIDLLTTVHPDPFAGASRGAIVEWADSGNISEIAARGMASVRTPATQPKNLTQTWNITVTELDCKFRFCQELTFEGNPDIAGIGIFASYIVEVILATLFILAIGAPYILGFKRYRTHRPFGETHDPSQVSGRAWSALNASLGIFWDSAFVFSLSIGVATIASTYTNFSFYDREFMGPSTSLTASVLFATWPLYIPSCRHRIPRWIGLLLIIGMMMFSFRTASSFTAKQRNSLAAFDIYCLDLLDEQGNGPLLDVVHVLRPAVFYVIPSFAAVLVIGYLVREVVLRWRGPDSWLLRTLAGLRLQREASGFGYWVLAWCFLLTGFMWAALVYFSFRRALMSFVAGESIQENQWGFGQVLALATWLPTVVDFVLVFANNQFKALDHRLPLGLKVRFPESKKQPDEYSLNRVDENGYGRRRIPWR